MKKIVIIVVLALMLKPIFPVIDYVANYHYIATVLCENKNKPELNCCGKCHLKKELAKASEGEKPNSSNKKDTVKQEVEVLFFQKIISYRTTFFDVTKSTFIRDNYSNLYGYLNGYSVFHPPTIAYILS